MSYKDEDGQAIILVALAMSIFLIGAVGLAIDGSHLFSQRQMAQTAADAAAQAGMMSVFNGTNTAGTAAFTASGSFACTTTDARTPCAYANRNGFGGSAGDTVTIDFPATSTVAGVNFSTNPSFPAVLIRATVQRSVNTTLMGLLGPTASTVQATAMAAIIAVQSAAPILVMHPTLANALSLSGTPAIQICGGPNHSIQVNSSAGTLYPGVAVSTGGNSSIDLSHAGPPDPGDCTTGTGADFSVVGGPTSSPSSIAYGSTGSYDPLAPVMQDPLRNVAPPPVPTKPGTQQFLGQGLTRADGVTCPASATKNCTVLSPGLYTGANSLSNLKLTTVLFKPGIYYIQGGTQGGGLSCTANCNMAMATGAAADGTTGTNTGWTGNILIYNTGPAANPTNAGPINIGANGSVSLVGSPANSSYLGILFFQDRSSVAQSHSMGGGGSLSLVGTIYLTNPLATMTADPTHYQSVSLQGGSGSSTLIQGEVIVGTLSMGGNAGITMNLSSIPLPLDQVALVN